MMQRRIILVTGGQRSGKSLYAEREALRLSPRPVYVATAHVGDDEFRERVRRHRERRGPEWTTVEEEFSPGDHDFTGRVVLVDCVTLWCTNLFFREGERVDAAYEAFTREFDRLTAREAVFIFVTNEIGLGGVSDNALMRRFTDLQGLANQYVASRADRVVLMVSGLPLQVK